MQNQAVVKCGDALTVLKDYPDEFFRVVVTSPPYFNVKDYGVEGQLGLEESPEAYVEALVSVFRECRRVLASDGTFWLNLGDSSYNYRPGKGQAMPKQTLAKTAEDLTSYCPRRGLKLPGLKEKDLIGIPWMTAFALREDGWYLRSEIVWDKMSARPESVKDRPARSHEKLFLFSKAQNYYYDWEAVAEESASTDSGLRNKRDVWQVRPTRVRNSVFHFARFPSGLITPCILSGSEEGDWVLDPFAGSGTVGLSALEHGRNCVLVDIKADYCAGMREQFQLTSAL